MSIIQLLRWALPKTWTEPGCFLKNHVKYIIFLMSNTSYLKNKIKYNFQKKKKAVTVNLCDGKGSALSTHLTKMCSQKFIPQASLLHQLKNKQATKTNTKKYYRWEKEKENIKRAIKQVQVTTEQHNVLQGLFPSPDRTKHSSVEPSYACSIKQPGSYEALAKQFFSPH